MDKVPLEQYEHPAPPPGYPGPPQQGAPGYPHPPANYGYPHPQPASGYPQASEPGFQFQPHAGPGYPVIQAQPVGYGPQAILIAPPLGPESVRTSCKSCGAEVNTRIDRKSSMRTHMFALLLCVFGCWPCCLIPYCMDSCQDSHHYCPACDSYMGTYVRN